MAIAIDSSLPILPGIDSRHLQQHALQVADPTHVSEARRTVVERAGALHFSETRTGEAAIVATEMAGNLVKHGGGGELLLRTIGEGQHAGIEMLALDRGPGMDVGRCLVDGYSTAASPGTGLGAIRRLSSDSDFYSLEGRGSAVLSTIWRTTEPPGRAWWTIGGVNIPLPGQEVCGDGWVVRCSERALDLMLVDGLGHGPEAAKASAEAARVFIAHPGRSPREHLDAADAALSSTRGAAMGVTAIDPFEDQARFAGIGNTVAIVLTGDTTENLVSFGGIVGQHRLHLREFGVAWTPGSIVIAHSDGINTRWRLGDYQGLAQRHPSIIAAILYRDFARGRDDASSVVIKARPR